MDEQKAQRIFRMQPILCPWITSQPYHSSLWARNKSNNNNDRFLNNPWINKQMPLGIPKSPDKPLPSIQQSSSQFFYFLRLMQLFPDTHPATLHTVLVLCKNDFFCAVDKMLYAKRCKLLCYKKNLIQKNQRNRSGCCGCVDPSKSTTFGTQNCSKIQPGSCRKDNKSDNSCQIDSTPEKAEDLSTIRKTDAF